MSQPLDRLTLLETFVRIADRGSISAAARDIGLSQASVSRQLKALEERLAVQLMHRTTHDLTLTPAGSSVLQEARILTADWQALCERTGAARQEVKGPLNVVAPVALGQSLLVEIAVSFQRRYPGVSFAWQLQDETIRVSEEGCDLWIRVGPVQDDSLIVHDLALVERIVVAHADFEGATLSEQRGSIPFVALEPFEGSRIHITGPDGQSRKLTPDIRFSTNNIFAAYRATLNGIGAMILPRWFVADDLLQGRLIELWPGWNAPELTVHAAYLPSRYQPKRLRAFVEAVKDGMLASPGFTPAGKAA